MEKFNDSKKENEYKKLSEEEYYEAKPQFYQKDNSILGACALTEKTLTLLPRKFEYAVQGKKVENYRLCICSTTKNKIIADLEYFKVFKELEKKAVSSSENYILVELGLDDLEEIINLVNN